MPMSLPDIRGNKKTEASDLGSPGLTVLVVSEGDYVLIPRNRPTSAAGGMVKYQK